MPENVGSKNESIALSTGDTSNATASATVGIAAGFYSLVKFCIRAKFVWFLLIAITIEILLFVLRSYAAPPTRVVETVLLSTVTSTVYILSVFLAFRSNAQDQRILLLILLAGIVFRITAGALPAPLTDDLYRYRWEGQLQDHGGNPYEVRPGDSAWAHLRDETYSRVGLKDFKAGYGPAWELISWGTYRLVAAFVEQPAAQILWFKLPAAIFDLATLGTLLALLRARGLSLLHVIAYAWSPLVIFEFWGSGHNDAVPVFFIVLALTLAARLRWTGAWLSLSVGIALKFWPALLIPVFLVKSRRPGLLLLPLFVLTAFALPYWTSVQENAQFLTGFVGGWRNNDSFFGLLLLAAPDVYIAKYAAFFLIAAASLWLATRAWPLERIVLWTIVCLLLLSSNCHPWYLTWFIPLLALWPEPGLLLWTALMPLTYSVWIDWHILQTWNGSTSIRWLVYIPVFLVLLLSRRFRTLGIATQPARR